ncbi:hypothetical protein EVAR_6242_1 [Eumeta japonica]|uniref:Uncharacterized protein n=1 Tax=Eumeta variegata TaxID=151549 RepID=A0A4C1T962_EUMVA|nr:hypothetical protein EVAR_6242_1 [Eumeta japonica]
MDENVTVESINDGCRKRKKRGCTSENNKHFKRIRWSTSPMDTCELKGITSALLAFWVGIEYPIGEGKG